MSAAPEPLATDRLAPAAVLQLVVAVLLLGAAWPITRVALLQGAGAAWFALGRAGFSCLVAFVALAAVGRLKLPRRADLPSLVAVGALQVGLFFALAHAAVAIIPAGRTSILANSTIVFTVPLSLLILRERISARRWLATACGAAGIVALTGPWSIDWRSPEIIRGHLYLMGSALSWALAIVITRLHPPRMTMFELLPWAFALASLILLPLALSHGRGTWNREAMLCMGVIGFVVAPIGTWCVMQAQVLLPIVVTSVGFLAGPALGVLLSTYFLHEPFGPDMLLGALLILAGAALAATRGRRR